MKDIVIFTGGAHPDISALYKVTSKEKIAFTIASDSGLEVALDNGITPDLVVGDFDSVSPALLRHLDNSRVIRYPRDKDYTDTQLALLWAKKIGAHCRVILFGGSGGRLDHFFSLYNTFNKKYRPNLWLTSEQAVYYIKKGDRVFLRDKTSGAIGVIRLSNYINKGRIKTRGLQWEGKQFFSGVLATACNRIADSNKSRVATLFVSSGKFLLCASYSALVIIRH